MDDKIFLCVSLQHSHIALILIIHCTYKTSRLLATNASSDYIV